MTTLFDGGLPGWTGHVTHKVAITPSDTVVYSTPLRVLACLTSGTVTYVLSDDDTTVAGNYVTRTLVAGQELTYYAIKQVRATGTTATVEGFV